jgi:predicted nucleotidyltransferase
MKSIEEYFHMIDKKANRIAKAFKKEVEKKYRIIEIKLFGSSARGDNNKISDIDIMVKLPEMSREIEEDLFNIAYELELEYDCLIDIIALPNNIDSDLPIVTNIEREGISI